MSIIRSDIMIQADYLGLKISTVCTKLPLKLPKAIAFKEPNEPQKTREAVTDQGHPLAQPGRHYENQSAGTVIRVQSLSRQGSILIFSPLNRTHSESEEQSLEILGQLMFSRLSEIRRNSLV
jgi:hypothetical protein